MKNWKVINSTSKFARRSIEEIVSVILKNRGLKTKKDIEDFLNPKLESVSLESVKINKLQVKKALKRIKQAIKNNENIVIYGDYDVDGICGSAILWETIYAFYKNVTPYIPHRVDEGYGLSVTGIKNLESKIQNVGLIITVDNGIVAHAAVDFANKNKIDVIITDHHVAQKKLPKAHAIIHTTKLCGTGVAYLLSKEIKNEISNIKNKDNHLELVALATVADMVPLMEANRTLLSFGLEKIKKTTRLGLLALFKQAGIEKENIGVYEIGRIIAPRLNAAGRVASAMDSLRLICTRDRFKAESLALSLGETNKERQLLTAEMSFHAISLFGKAKQNILFAASKDYNQGVVGLIASRLVEKYYRPSIAVSIGEDISKGSARSVRGVNIIEFIRLHSEFLVNAGGHPMAAGFTIKTEQIEVFKKAIEKSAKEIIKDEHLVRNVEIDCELGFENISIQLFEQIQKLSPFGMGNPEPIFLSKNVRVESLKLVGKERNHLKLGLFQKEKLFQAMFFNGADADIKIGDIISVVYNISVNVWNGRKELVLKIKDLRVKD